MIERRTKQAAFATALLSVAGLGAFGISRTVSAQGAGVHEALTRTAPDEIPVLAALSREFRRVAAAVEPSVVHIQVSGRTAAHDGLSPQMPEELRRFFGLPDGALPRRFDAQPQNPYRDYDVPPTMGVGSGWIYSADGYVVTNNHVVRAADSILVRLHDGAEYDARVVAADAATDIAVLRIDAEGLHPARLSTEPVSQGDIVFAFGSPLQFEFSLSQGVVAGTGRRTGILGPSGYENFIQTDAAINPGNSGGPLTDIHGDVIGMNTAIASRSGFFSGMGFAVPAPMIEPVVEQLIEDGRVQRGFLGVQIQDDPDLLRSFGYEGRGVLVSDVVPDGPAAAAGIERGDIIVSLDGRDVETTAELRQRVASERPNQEIAVAIVRGREQRTIDVKLGTMPAEVAADGSPSEDGRLQPRAAQESLRKLGIEGAETLTSDLAGRYEVEDVRGVLVLSVRAQSVAASVGLRPGSVITEVGNESVESLGDLTDALAEKDLQQGVRLTVREAGVNHFVFLKLPA